MRIKTKIINLLPKAAKDLSLCERREVKETEICLSPTEGEQIPNVYRYELIAEELRRTGYPVMTEIETLMGAITAVKSQSKTGEINYALRGRSRNVKTILSINQAH